MREKRYSQLFSGRRRSIAPRICLIAFLSLFVVACSNNLEEKLLLIEQRVLDETSFGRQMRAYMKSKKTRYVLDPRLPYQARYSIVDDTIHYNPKFNPSLEQWKQELLWGRPLNTILNFHEELHRTQVAFSERGAFFHFFRENGHIDERFLPNGRVQSDFDFLLKPDNENKILRFAGSLVGYPVLDISTAGEIVRQKMDEMNAPQREQLLLHEIQAYLGSDIVTAKGVYSQLYETKGKGYENLPKISFDDFSHLCDFIVQLYGFYEGNHDEVCKVVGKSKSIKDFKVKVKSIFWGCSEEDINQKAYNWMEMKKEWARETIRIAEEVLK